MRHLYVALIVMLLSCCKNLVKIAKTNKETNLAVKSRRYRGTIFTDKYLFRNFHVADIDSNLRFTPTQIDVEEAELILKTHIKEVNDRYIEKQLRYYFRLYVGFRNSKGEKCIHINLYWNMYPLQYKLKGYTDDWITFNDEYAIVFDGGHHYWQININLANNSISDLQVNGVA